MSIVQHAYRRLSEAEGIERVIVATDDARVGEAVRSFGGEVSISSREHQTGTDRVAEVVAELEWELVVNLQLDQPFLSSGAIGAALNALAAESSFAMSTLVKPVSLEEAQADSDGVTVVMDRKGTCFYFSRAVMPPQGWPTEEAGEGRWVWHHIGLYCYRRSFLLRLAASPRSPLERVEGLEQLRAMEEGGKILGVPTREAAFWLHRPAELDQAESFVAATREAAKERKQG
jgi:3-deoxy-manno-octulosonate cytidylyltransferase (CMP-KDO synthetase)